MSWWPCRVVRGLTIIAETAGSVAHDSTSVPRDAGLRELWHRQPGRHVALLLAASGLVIGLAVVSEWPARLQSETAPIAASRHATTRDTIQRLEAEQSRLKQQIADLRASQASDPKAASAAPDLESALEDQRAIAGILPLRGPGVDVLLDDSTSHLLRPSDDPDNYIVHEYQLRDVVNLLWKSGASGISVNGERFVNSTSVYCVGSTILINDTRTSPPYHILAVGDSTQMLAALDDGRSLKDIKDRTQAYGLVLRPRPVDLLTLPGFDGSISMPHVALEPGATTDRPR